MLFRKSVYLFIIILFSCKYDNKSKHLDEFPPNDTIVVFQKDCLDSSTLDAFVIIKGDTSTKMFSFSNHIVRFQERITCDLLDTSSIVVFPSKNEIPTKTSRESLNEFRIVLDNIKNKKSIDSLKGINIGILTDYPDLALETKNEYISKFEKSAIYSHYKDVENIILQSNFVKSLNKILAIYSLHVKAVSVEKVFFSAQTMSCMTYFVLDSDK